MKKYLKLFLATFIVVVISLALYFLYLNNDSTKEEPKRAKFVKADHNKHIEVIHYRKA